MFTETQTDYDNTPKRAIRKFPDAPVVRTQHFHCRGPGFDPWSSLVGDPASCVMWPKKKVSLKDLLQKANERSMI